MNHLTGAGVLSEDKLFATLDPTTRRLELDNGEEMLFTDTVGFIRKLPHHLVQAFRSTLEEAKYADVILHVVDCSNPDMDAQMETVYETLQRLEVGDKPIVTAFNKVDCISEEMILKDLRADKTVRISAKYGEGIEKMLSLLSDVLKENKVILEMVFPYGEGAKLSKLRKYGQLLSEEYQSDGIFVKACLDREYLYLFQSTGE